MAAQGFQYDRMMDAALRGVMRDALARAGIAEGLVRLSIGLEDAQDLIDDLARALSVSQK